MAEWKEFRFRYDLRCTVLCFIYLVRSDHVLAVRFRLRRKKSFFVLLPSEVQARLALGNSTLGAI